MKITLTDKPIIASTKKDGTPLISKKGKPYKMCLFKCNEYKDRWVSGFYRDEMESWNGGDEIEVDIEEKNGYLNFSMPDKYVSRKEFDEFKQKVEQFMSVGDQGYGEPPTLDIDGNPEF